ncbi:unnamed protein product, partial [Didymodactylos carnosus]
IEDDAMSAVPWQSTYINELDISSTELSEDCLLDIFFRMPRLKYLAVPYCDGFTDKVLELLVDHGKLSTCHAIDLSNTVNLSSDVVYTFLMLHGKHLHGLSYAGNANVTEQFWRKIVGSLENIKRIITKVHVDQILDVCAHYCPELQRLEIQWDADTVRFSELNSKFIDNLRIRCIHLQSLVLSDGAYYESVKANFERANRNRVVRTTTSYRTTTISLLDYYNQLKFN